MKSSLFIALVAFTAALGPSKANLPEDPSDYREWESKMLEAIAKYRSVADEKAHTKLATYIYSLSLSFNLEHGDRPVFRAAQEALISMPDHADFLRRWIEEEIQDEFAEAASNPRPFSERLGRHESFEVLSHLPTPETVRVLGELLSDERDPWKDEPPSDSSRPSRNCVFAGGTLNKLGLESSEGGEIKRSGQVEAVLNDWKLWYAQVKAGSRTFRFKGDPKEYNLKGPIVVSVSEAVLPDVTAPVPVRAVTDDESLAWRWPLWVALGVLGGGVCGKEEKDLKSGI